MTNLLIAILLFAGAVILQIYLSTRQNKWLGFILPALFVLLSLLNILNIADTGNTATNASLIAMTALTSNIPTIILLVIYAICREKIKRKKEIEKMSIHDLK